MGTRTRIVGGITGLMLVAGGVAAGNANASEFNVDSTECPPESEVLAPLSLFSPPTATLACIDDIGAAGVATGGGLTAVLVGLDQAFDGTGNQVAVVNSPAETAVVLSSTDTGDYGLSSRSDGSVEVGCPGGGRMVTTVAGAADYLSSDDFQTDLADCTG